MRALLASALSTGLVVAQQPDPDQLLKSALEGQRHRDFRTAIRQYCQVLAKPDLVPLRLAGRGHAPLLDEPECLAAIDAFLARIADSFSSVP
jgi:hypothetical protein